ncbi:unnamed protein product [marine sediment metagenome]|uniref:Uncharacterized protein n=1 Tax=marine sediment metagenome TaxID=412755 RepID=X1CLA0_9ZZZZ
MKKKTKLKRNKFYYAKSDEPLKVKNLKEFISTLKPLSIIKNSIGDRFKVLEIQKTNQRILVLDLVGHGEFWLEKHELQYCIKKN